MNPRGLVLCLCAAWLTLPSLALAETLTLERAITLALSANPDLRAVAAAEAEARERRRAARVAWFPRAEVQEGWQRGDQPVFVFGSLLGQRRFTEANFALAALNHPDPLNNFRTGVTVTQSVFDGGASTAAARAAGAAASLASLSRQAAGADVTVAVSESYARVMKAEAAVRAAAAAIAAATEDLTRARARRDAGMATDADVLSLEVHLAQMRARQITSSSDAEIARATLNRLIGVGLDQQWDLVEPAFRGVTALGIVAAETTALRNRPDVAGAALRVDLARANALGARAALLPSVGVEGGYEWNGGTWNSRASSWVLGIRAQWSLSLSGAERATVRASQHAEDRARAEQVATETAARLDVRNAIARLNAARAQEEVAQATVAQARESERIVRDRYDAGLANVTDVLRVANASLEADALDTAARIDVHVAAVILDRALGRAPGARP